MRGSALIGVLVATAVLTAGGSTVLAQAPPAAPAACPGTDRVAPAASVPQTRAALTCLIDASRAARSLDPLRVNPHLQTAAQSFAHALDPAKPLTHSGKGGSTPLDRIADAGYARGASGFSAAETLGRSQGALAAPAARIAAWLKVPSTRKLLLSGRYRDIGVGVVSKGDETTFVVEVAARATASPPRSGSK